MLFKTSLLMMAFAATQFVVAAPVPDFKPSPAPLLVARKIDNPYYHQESPPSPPRHAHPPQGTVTLHGDNLRVHDGQGGTQGFDQHVRQNPPAHQAAPEHPHRANGAPNAEWQAALARLAERQRQNQNQK